MPKPRPTFADRPRITFHLTDRCPYQCKFCFVPPIRGTEELPAATWIAAARELGDLYPGAEVIVTGGEPILFPGIFDLLAAMAEADLAVHFNSSGFGIGPGQAQSLADAGVQAVNVSLDGPSAVHNHLRGHPDAYRFAQETLDNLAGNAPAVRRNIVMVLMGANAEIALAFLRELDADTRVDGIYLQTITNPEGPDGTERWRADPELWPPDRQRRRELFTALSEWKQAGSKLLNPPTGLALQARFFADPNFRLAHKCRVAEFGFCIDARGDVSLCGRFAPAGNIATQPLTQTLTGRAFADVRREMAHCSRGCHRQINCASALPEKA